MLVSRNATRKKCAEKMSPKIMSAMTLRKGNITIPSVSTIDGKETIIEKKVYPEEKKVLQRYSQKRIQIK